MKTVRFTQVVAACGRPQVYLQFAAPARDPTLLGLVKQARIMTVHQKARGGGKDYGTIGLHTSDRSQFLVFPRSLKRFAERRVIGIDYSLLVDAGTGRSSPARRGRGPAKPAVGSVQKKASIVPFAEAPDPPKPPRPPAPREVVAEIRAALRQLAKRRIAAARERLEALARRIEPGEESE